MPDYIIATSHPEATIAFWETVLGRIDPPCRRHPDTWLSTWTNTAIVRTCSTLSEGLHINVSEERASSARLAAVGGFLETDALGRGHLIDPCGTKVPLSTIPAIPRRVEEFDWRSMVKAVGAAASVVSRGVV